MRKENTLKVIQLCIWWVRKLYGGSVANVHNYCYLLCKVYANSTAYICVCVCGSSLASLTSTTIQQCRYCYMKNSFEFVHMIRLEFSFSLPKLFCLFHTNDYCCPFWARNVIRISCAQTLNTHNWSQWSALHMLLFVGRGCSFFAPTRIKIHFSHISRAKIFAKMREK